MIKQVLVLTTSTTAKNAVGKLQGFDADGIVIDLTKVSGVHTLAALRNFEISATLRKSNGGSINLINANVYDVLKFSDFVGGLSSKLAGDAGTKFVGYLPIGNIMIDGDDSLDIELRHSGHATAIFDCEVFATDLFKASESIKGYESITGTGQEVALKDVYGIYICSAGTGANISVQDYERQYFVTDKQAIAVGLALGRMEQFDDFGPLYQDGTELSQNVRIKLPLGAYCFVVRGYFPIERIDRKAQSLDIKIRIVGEQIALDNAEKYNYLIATGRYSAE